MKLIADAWRDFEIQVVPLNASDVQRVETRRAFYQGANAMFTGIVGMLEPGKDPTEKDLRKMDEIQAEIDQFMGDLRERRA